MLPSAFAPGTPIPLSPSPIPAIDFISSRKLFLNPETELGDRPHALITQSLGVLSAFYKSRLIPTWKLLTASFLALCSRALFIGSFVDCPLHQLLGPMRVGTVVFAISGQRQEQDRSSKL